MVFSALKGVKLTAAVEKKVDQWLVHSWAEQCKSIWHCLETGVGGLVFTNNLCSELACAQSWAS